MPPPGPLGSASDPWIRWDWVAGHRELITDALGQHLELTSVAVLVGLVLSFPLALAARRWGRLRGPVLGGAGVVYAIPSLALFALLVPWTGLTTTTSEIGLVGYTLLILIRNILAGLDSVPAELREAAEGLGFGRRRLLARVELPLALPAIVAGVRIATVTTIGLVTVTAFISQGGLGQLILDGLIRDFRTPLVVGTVLSVALAVAADAGLAGLARLLTPWAGRNG